MSDVQLDQAARQTFLELGPSAPVADVARRLGVSQAALFHRVGSKEALMLRSLCPGVPEALAVWLRPPSAGQPLAQQLQPVLSELLGFLRAAIPGLLVLRSGGVPLEKAMPPGPPPPVALRAALATFLAAASRRGLTRLSSPPVIAEALLSALEARVFNAWLGGVTFTKRQDNAFLAALIAALIPPPPGQDSQ